MEQQHRSENSFGDHMNPKMRRRGQNAEDLAFEALASSLQGGRVWAESFAVKPVDASELLRSRWQAEVRVRVPSFVLDETVVVEEARSALHGREALVAAEKGSIWALFLVTNAGDENRALVERFTSCLIHRLDAEKTHVVLSTIRPFDTADIDRLLPSEQRPRDLEP